MKGFLSFVIAVIAYLILGLIAWNIVCSIVDIQTKTLLELADYRVMTYSCITLILSFILLGGDCIDGSLIVLGINLGIAIV